MDKAALLNTLPRSASKTLAAIEATLGDAQTVAISYDAIADNFRIGRASLRYALRVLKLVGLIEIGVGRNRCSVFSTSDAYRKLSDAQVVRRIAQARLPRPGRVKLAPPKPQPKAHVETEDEDDEPETYQTPSLPRLKFLEGWEG
jgi:hypothetical protein